MNKFIKCLTLLLMAFSATIFTINKGVVLAETSNINSDCKSSYLIDYNSKKVLSSHNENERLPIASMTKIMLLLLAYENVDNGTLSLDESVIVSENASSMGGSQVFLEKNGEYKVGDLLKAITISSANDASVAIAEKLYGSEQECVNAMNEKVEELKLKNTLFANCTGLPKPMQYSSAKDITLIFAELISHEKYFENSTIWLDSISHKSNSTEMSNTNKLIKYYEGCDGGKTGFTREAGFCLTATAKRGNMRLISCCIGASDSKTRFKVVSDNFNYGFNNYCNKVVIEKETPVFENVKVSSSNNVKVNVYPEKNYYVFSKRNEKLDVSFEYNFDKLKAPISKGEVVGEIIVCVNGVENGRVNLIVNENVKKANFFENIKNIANSWAN